MQLSSHLSSHVATSTPGMLARPALRTPVPHDHRESLMALARRPSYGVSLALAGVVSASWEARGQHCLPLFGLDADTTRSLMEDHFPGASALTGCAWNALEVPTAFADAQALHDLVELLTDHRTVEDEDSRWLAHAMATACLGQGFLWQDMRLPTHGVLSDLVFGFFTSLAVRNRHGLHWKRFFYETLCDRAARAAHHMPSDRANDYKRCFGSDL